MTVQFKLPSRHTVLAYRRVKSDRAIALVHLPDNAATPFATYTVQPETLDCAWGDYLHTHSEDAAMAAFTARALEYEGVFVP